MHDTRSLDALLHEHRAVWDGRDEAGSAVASGVYLLRLRALHADGDFIQMRRMLLLK